jgi:hypothetical protein
MAAYCLTQLNDNNNNNELESNKWNLDKTSFLGQNVSIFWPGTKQI